MKKIEKILKRPLAYKIDKNDENIVGHVIGISYIILFLLVGYIVLENNYKNILDIRLNTQAVEHLTTIFIITSLIYIVLVIIFYKFLMKVRNIQKLADLIFTSQFYIKPQVSVERRKKINNLFDLLDLEKKEENRSALKTMYFPDFYISQKGGKVQVYIYLDGSKFQDQYIELNEKLELVYSRIIIDKYIENEHQVYILKSFDEKERLHFDNNDEEKYSIRFMQSLYWNFRKEPHALVTGSTGSGKSYLLFYLIKEILRKGYKLKIIDPKKSDLSQFERISDKIVSYNKENMIDTIREVSSEMENRYEYMLTFTDKFGQDFTAYDLPAYFLVIDEYTAFLSVLETKEKKEVEALMRNIVLKGRQAGINVVFTTQRPDANVIDGAIRDQLHFRLGLGKMSREGYRMLFPEENSSYQELDAVAYGYYKIIGIDKLVKVFLSPLIDNLEEVQKEIISLIKEKGEN